jgi:hypothetical protein
MTTFPINMPVSDAARLSLSMHDITRASVSPYTGKGQFFDWDSGWWSLTITIPPVGRDEAQKWLAFLAALRGRVGTFQTTIPGHSVPLGAARETAGVPRVKGADQTGDDVLVDGMPSSTFEYLAQGDLIQIGTRLYVVTERVSTDSDGEKRINVWPRIEEPHADDTRVIVSGAVGLFRLSSDVRGFDIESFDTYGCTFQAEEVR